MLNAIIFHIASSKPTEPKPFMNYVGPYRCHLLARCSQRCLRVGKIEEQVLINLEAMIRIDLER